MNRLRLDLVMVFVVIAFLIGLFVERAMCP
jgi:hypothetical protein